MNKYAFYSCQANYKTLNIYITYICNHNVDKYIYKYIYMHICCRCRPCESYRVP